MSTTSPEFELYDWQKDHVNRLVSAIDQYGTAFDGSDTGTGKTVMALETAQRLGRIPFVVCPKAVIPAWEEWMERMDFPMFFAKNYEKLRGGRTPFVKREGKQLKWLLRSDLALLVFDEVHRCKADRSWNSKMLAAAKRSGTPTLMLSATACSDPVEMKSIGFALDMHDGKSWWNWCLRNGCRRGRFGGLKFGGSAEVLKRFHTHIYEGGRGSRIRIADLPEGSFPETVISANGYGLESPEALDSIYSDLFERLAALEERKAEDTESPLTLQLRARQEAELLKVPVFSELANDALAEGNSVVVFVNFRETLDALNERLSDHSPAHIIGGHTDEERAEEIRRFQSNETAVCLCMTQAGGTGLSLHDEHGDHPRVALISPSFSAIDLKQALGRVHRAGGATPSVQNIVFASGTVEMRVCRAVRGKLKNLDLVNDDDLNPLL